MLRRLDTPRSHFCWIFAKLGLDKLGVVGEQQSPFPLATLIRFIANSNLWGALRYKTLE